MEVSMILIIDFSIKLDSDHVFKLRLLKPFLRLVPGQIEL